MQQLIQSLSTHERRNCALLPRCRRAMLASLSGLVGAQRALKLLTIAVQAIVGSATMRLVAKVGRQMVAVALEGGPALPLPSHALSPCSHLKLDWWAPLIPRRLQLDGHPTHHRHRGLPTTCFRPAARLPS